MWKWPWSKKEKNETPEQKETREKAEKEKAARKQAKRDASPKLGGEVKQYFRMGLRDLQDAVLKPFPESSPGHSQEGTAGNPTPQTVMNDLYGHSAFRDLMGRMKEQGLQKVKEMFSPQRAEKQQIEQTQ